MENLEDRLVPSCAIRQVGDTLIIRGDDRPNAITIDDNGSGVAHNIQIHCGNGSTFTSGNDPVTRIIVRTGDGPDAVNYNLTGDTASALAVDVRLGADHDTFVAHLNGHTLLAGADYRFNVLGGRGRDDIDFFSNDEVAISSGARLAVNAFGGRGADNLSIGYRGLLDGRLNFHLFGGPGLDVLSARIDIFAGSTGSLGLAGDDATLNGGPGNDNLTYLVHTNGSTADVFALLNGGPGKNTCTHTKNVTVVNCTHDHVVP
jgi:hypothetical protein